MDDRKSTKSAKSLKSLFRDEEVETYIVVPPDGGWGWVVVLAAFASNLIADGITFTFGIFLEELSKSFGVTIGRITMVGSVINFSYYFVGPFVSALVNRYGFRFVAILGSSFASFGFIISSFCYSFPLFLFAAGIFIGMGLGMVTIPAVIVVGFYFERWRALATGIATCGSGIGTLLTPPLINFLLGRLGWRNTYRVLSGLVLGPALLAILYRPLLPKKAVQEEKEIQIINQTDSILTIESDINQKCCNWCRRHHNRFYPTTADLVPIETVILENAGRDDDVSSLSINTYATQAIVTNYTSSVTQNNTQVIGEYSRSNMVSPQPERKCVICFNKFMNKLCCGYIPTMSRPMYRDDIFFGHSLMLLPQYKESLATQRTIEQESNQMPTTSRSNTKPKSTGYHMSVTRVTTLREISADDNRCSCHLAIIRTLSTMMDFRLLKSPAFQMFAWTGMFIVFGYMIPYLYIKDRAIAGQLPPEISFWLLSAIGAANTVGRIISGILPSITNLKVIEYSYFCISVAGIMTLISGLSMTMEFQFAYACVYGMAGSCIATLRPIIVVELFGLEHLTNAYGLQMIYMAIAVFSGTTLAGYLYDTTHNYNATFYMSGGCLLFSACMLSVIRMVRNYEKEHCNIKI